MYFDIILISWKSRNPWIASGRQVNTSILTNAMIEPTCLTSSNSLAFSVSSGWKWQPTLVFFPGKFHGQRSLAGYSPWAHKESDLTVTEHVHKTENKGDFWNSNVGHLKKLFSKRAEHYFHMKSWLHMKSCPFIRVCSNLPNGILNSLWESQLAEAFIRERNVSYSIVSDSATPRTVAHRAPLSMGFSRQEYWSGLSCPPPGDLPNLGFEPRSPALQVDSFPSEPPEKSQ